MNLKQELYLVREWYRAHREFGIKPDWREFKRVRAAYAEKHRHYHTWQHIYECCLFTRKHYGLQPLVVMALFYHDIVYDVTRKDNEELSAQQWIDYATSRGLHRVAYIKMNLIADGIRMTATHKITGIKSLFYDMLNDADMHVFLCPDSHYLEYAQNIWREYRGFGREKYLEGRLAFLNSVDPLTMYYTHQATRMVHHAKANLDLEKTILETDPDRILTAS